MMVNLVGHKTRQTLCSVLTFNQSSRPTLQLSSSYAQICKMLLSDTAEEGAAVP